MPTKDSKTQSITYGAMIIAIFGMLLLLNRQTGSFFEEVFLYIFPIPMVAYAAIYGWKRSLPVFVGMCLISFLCGTFTSIFYAISQAFIGLVFGTSLNHHRDMTRTLLMVMVLSALANILSTVVLATLFGYNITAEVTAMQQGMHESLQKALEFSGGTSNPQNVQTMEAMKSILTFDYMKRMFILCRLPAEPRDTEKAPVPRGETEASDRIFSAALDRLRRPGPVRGILFHHTAPPGQ